jgi:hypothetical protein
VLMGHHEARIWAVDMAGSGGDLWWWTWPGAAGICFPSLSLLMLIWMYFFANMDHEFLTLLVILFVAFLALERSFKLISLPLNLL